MVSRRGGVSWVVALALLLSLPLEAYNEKLAKVEIANYITPPSNANAVNPGQIDVMISNMQNTTEFHNFTNIDTSHHSGVFNVSVSESNGLQNYWSILVTCVMKEWKMEEFLFLNASARDNMKYTIYFYNICSNDTSPEMWIGEGQDHDHSATGIDKAILILDNQMFSVLNYSQKSDNCYKCLDRPVSPLRPGETVIITLDTTFPLTLYVNDTNGTICSIYQHFTEHSVYHSILTEGNNNCTAYRMNNSGDNTYLPILYAASVILAVTVFMVLCYVGYKTWRIEDDDRLENESRTFEDG